MCPIQINKSKLKMVFLRELNVSLAEVSRVIKFCSGNISFNVLGQVIIKD